MNQERSAPRFWSRELRLAAAAVLLIGTGVVLGRLSTGSGAPVASNTPPSASQPGTRTYQVASSEHLTDAEALLTSYPQPGAQPWSAADSATLALDVWARNVLTNTRLLLDSPAAADPTRRALLEDLELLLVQLVQDGSGSAVNDPPDPAQRDQLLTRLRAAIAAAPIS